MLEAPDTLCWMLTRDSVQWQMMLTMTEIAQVTSMLDVMLLEGHTLVEAQYLRV